MKLLAERGVQVFFTQVFRDSFFHVPGALHLPWRQITAERMSLRYYALLSLIDSFIA